jgi:hypothetical protein
MVLTPAPEFRIRMEWREEGIARWGLGSPALSVGLPIGMQVGPRDMRGRYLRHPCGVRPGLRGCGHAAA